MRSATGVKYPKRLAALAAAWLAPALASCGLAPHDEPTCDPAAPPSCAEGDVLVTCSADGQPSTEACAETCLVLSDAAGHQSAACVATGTAACQSATFAPSCVGTDATLTCMVVAPLEGAGHTTLTACNGETVCRQSAETVACVDPRAEPCDPATHLETCDGADVIVCDESGFTTPLVTCAAPTMCKVSAGDARCVRPDQDPCAMPFVETCVDAVTVETCSAGFTACRIRPLGLSENGT
jgi:hypothetical protein